MQVISKSQSKTHTQASIQCQSTKMIFLGSLLVLAPAEKFKCHTPDPNNSRPEFKERNLY